MESMKERASSTDMCPFGHALNQIMVRRGIYEWQDLREALKRVGYDIGQSQLSQYVHGKRNPREPQKLFAAIDRALKMTEDERCWLALAFMSSSPSEN